MKLFEEIFGVPFGSPAPTKKLTRITAGLYSFTTPSADGHTRLEFGVAQAAIVSAPGAKMQIFNAAGDMVAEGRILRIFVAPEGTEDPRLDDAGVWLGYEPQPRLRLDPNAAYSIAYVGSGYGTYQSDADPITELERVGRIVLFEDGTWTAE